MLLAERRNLIILELQENKKVVVSELSKKFNVSEETIRRDLDKLSEEGLVVKGYGGAVLKEDYGMELPFNVRYKMNPEGKKVIAELAVQEISNRDYISLDASSTTVFLSRAIRGKQFEKLTVITNSVENAITLSSAPGCELVLSGGTLHSDSMSLMGAKAIESISAYHVNKAFISCNGLDMERGITEGNDEVVSMKQAIINAAESVILLIDSDKFDKVSFSQVCDISRIEMLITDRKPEDHWLESFYEKDIKIKYPGAE